MQYILLGYDGADEDALDRRMAVREQHLALFAENRAAGKVLFGCAMLNEAGKMAGSMLVVEFESRAALDAYLAVEPYVSGNVWQRIEVLPAAVPASMKA